MLRRPAGDLPGGQREAGPALTRQDPSVASTAAGGDCCIGIIHYRAYADLEACLESVRGQTLPPASVWVIDADGDPARRRPLESAFPEVVFEAADNRGYSAAANRILERASAEASSASFCLLLNPDVVLDPTFCEILVAAMDAHPSAALGTGKLLRPGRTRLDSAGIALPAQRRPRDRGSGEEDHGQYDRAEYVFGASGAALMLRRSALPDLALDGEIFDEDFFLYHEDTDLAWRSGVLGWKVYYEPGAQAVHARGWRKEGRFDVPSFARRHSFKNHYLQLIKNESCSGFLLRLPILAAWEALRLAHALVRDRQVLGGYGDALRLAGRAFRKRRLLWARASARPLR